MDLLDRLAALSDSPYRMRPPRRDSLPDQLWRTLRLIAQWLLSALALLWRFAPVMAHRFSYALERAGRGALQASRPLALRLASNRRVQGVAALIGVCALIAHAGLASAQFIQPGLGIPGWSFVEQARCIACQVANSPNAQHILTADEYADLLMGRMTLDEQLGQLIIVQFAGQSATPEALRMVTDQGVGGVLSFAANIQTGDQTRAMTSDLQHAAAIPLVDERGSGGRAGQPLPRDHRLAARRERHDDAGDRLPAWTARRATACKRMATTSTWRRSWTWGPRIHSCSTARLAPIRSTVATLAGAYMAGLQESGSGHRLPQALPRHRRDDDGSAPGSASPDTLARRLGAH